MLRGAVISAQRANCSNGRTCIRTDKAICRRRVTPPEDIDVCSIIKLYFYVRSFRTIVHKGSTFYWLCVEWGGGTFKLNMMNHFWELAYERKSAASLSWHDFFLALCNAAGLFVIIIIFLLLLQV